MIIQFLNIDGNINTINVDVTDNSYRYRVIKGENSLTLYFSLPQHIDIPVGAWCMFEAERYELVNPSNFKKNNTRNYEYTLILEAQQSKLRKYKFRNTVDRRLKFSYTARPHEHLQLLVDNMNLRDPGWSLGECIDAVEKVISYNHVFCVDALIQIAEEFETEYEIVGKKIHLHKVEYNKDNPLPLSYGKGNGFKPGIGRANYNDSKPVEILYVQGGEENIDPSKYGSKELLLPKNATIRYNGASFDMEPTDKDRTYITDADGFSIKRNNKELLSGTEDSLDCSHISPKKIGIVSSVEVPDASKNFYDFIDNTIPADLNYTDCIIDGETMTVIFQSGMLAGKEFDVKYKHSEKRFEIVPQEIDGETMPNDVYKPVEGNTYAVFHIAMPDSYICNNADKSGASWDMFREAAKYLYENEEQKFTFTGELDGHWAKKDWLNIGGRIKLGGYILFSDPQFQPEGVAIRIIGIKDYINNPHSPEIELSNSTVETSITSELRKIESNEVVTNEQYKDSLSFTKRRYRDAVESAEMLINAGLSGFSQSVTPITISTMQLLVGAKDCQFAFVNKKTDPQSVVNRVQTFDNKTKQLTAEGGIIKHYTLGIEYIGSVHKANEYSYWDIPAFTSSVLTEQQQGYYLYARCSKSNSTAEFRLSPTPILLESETGWYHFLVGILNPEYEGGRSYAPMYGFSLIEPGRVIADKFQSSDFDWETFSGACIDFSGNPKRLVLGDNAEIITRKLTIKPPSGEEYNVDSRLDDIDDDIQDTQSLANNAQNTADDAQNYLNNVLVGELQGLQEQIDGQVESWFYEYDPTLTNYPANQWATIAEKEKHLNDTFTNNLSGNSWRWSKNSNNYSWVVIADTAATKALALAGQAKDTADGKRRVFTATPYTPYEVGDLWAQGTSGEIMRCIIPRLTGNYVASDWDKASKYTDDTAVNNLTIGDVNLVNGSFPVEPFEGNSGKYNIFSDDNHGYYLKKGNTYTITAELMVDNDFPQVDDSGIGFWVIGTQTIYPRFRPTEWKIIQVTFTANMDGFLSAYHFPNGSSGKSYIKWVKLVEGNKASLSWSPSIDDTQILISDAKKAGTDAQSAINAMNDDNVFDVAEKQNIRTQWEAIQGAANTTSDGDASGSYKKTIALASGKVSISNLVTLYGTLRTFLNTVQLYTNTNYTPFARQTMSGNFKNYYNEEVAVLDKVSKGYTDALAIGDINLVNNSYNNSYWSGNKDKYNICDWINGTDYIISGKQYTVVAELYVSGDFNGDGIGFWISGANSIGSRYKPTIATIISFTFTAPRSGFLSAYHMPGGSLGYSYIKWVKLVEGNKASLSWIPSIEDQKNMSLIPKNINILTHQYPDDIQFIGINAKYGYEGNTPVISIDDVQLIDYKRIRFYTDYTGDRYNNQVFVFSFYYAYEDWGLGGEIKMKASINGIYSGSTLQITEPDETGRAKFKITTANISATDRLYVELEFRSSYYLTFLKVYKWQLEREYLTDYKLPQQELDNRKIATNNLLINGGDYLDTSNWSTAVENLEFLKTESNWLKLQAGKQLYTWAFLANSTRLNEILKYDTNYIVRFKIRELTAERFPFYVQLATGDSSTQYTIGVVYEAGQHMFRFKLKQSDLNLYKPGDINFRFINFNDIVGNSLYVEFSNVILAEGTELPDHFIRSKYDNDYLRQALRRGRITQEGGVLLGNVLGVSNIVDGDPGMTDVRAGISGLNDKVAFFADDNDAYNKAYKYMNGLSSVRPKFLVDETGRMYAVEGLIGVFEMIKKENGNYQMIARSSNQDIIIDPEEQLSEIVKLQDVYFKPIVFSNQFQTIFDASEFVPYTFSDGSSKSFNLLSSIKYSNAITINIDLFSKTQLNSSEISNILTNIKNSMEDQAYMIIYNDIETNIGQTGRLQSSIDPFSQIGVYSVQRFNETVGTVPDIGTIYNYDIQLYASTQYNPAHNLSLRTEVNFTPNNNVIQIKFTNWLILYQNTGLAFSNDNIAGEIRFTPSGSVYNTNTRVLDYNSLTEIKTSINKVTINKNQQNMRISTNGFLTSKNSTDYFYAKNNNANSRAEMGFSGQIEKQGGGYAQGKLVVDGNGFLKLI